MDLGKALEFVGRAGDAVEQARLQYLLAAERPSRQVVAMLLAGQRGDGGWSPFWADGYSSLDATCFRLAQAEQLGINAQEPAIRRALDGLAQRQSTDGSWEEDAQVAGLAPHWVTPGDLSARLYLTANCGLWLALWGDGERATRAASYLESHLDGDGRLPGYLHTHWLAAGLWHRLGRQEPAARVCEFLRRRLGDLAASNLSWLLTTLCAAGVPAQCLLDEAAWLLAQAQQADGRWPSEDGPSRDVHSTLEALRALQLCGRIPGPEIGDSERGGRCQTRDESE